MGMLDILTNPEVRAVLTSLAGQAQSTLQQFGQKVPQSMGNVVGAGALGALLGSILPKGAAGAAGMVGLGAIAWNFYKKWASENSAGAAPNPLVQQDPAAMLLLRALIYAARADGQIDATENRRIEQVLPQLFPNVDMRPFVEQVLKESIDPSVLAAQVSSKDQAEDLYRLSCVVVDIDHFMEQSYFAALAKQLSLTPERAKELEAEAQAVKQQLAQYS